MTGQIDFKSQISALENADEIILMLVSEGHLINRIITDANLLRRFAYVYKIDNADGIANVYSILYNGIVDVGHYISGLGFRIGIVFKKGSSIIAEFYFNDINENGERVGLFGNQCVRLLSDASNAIYSLPEATNATLIAPPGYKTAPRR
jgi:hypothetical protein